MGAHTAPRTCTSGRLVGRGALTVAAALALTGGTASFAFAGVSSNEDTSCDTSCEKHDEVEAHDCDDDCTHESEDVTSEDEDCDDDHHDGRHATWDHDDERDRDHHDGDEWDRKDEKREFKAYKTGFKDGFEYGYDKGSEEKAGGLLDELLGGGNDDADTPAATTSAV